MFVCSVLLISVLDSQSKFQMLTLFSGRHVGTPTWPLHTKLYNFARNISKNISTSGQRTYLKHREPEHVIRDENKCILIYVCSCVFFSRLEEI